MITDISPSSRQGKRYVATVITPDGIKKIHFGLKGANTYIDGAAENIKDAYWARHMGNPIERRLINNLTASPATFSAYLLWGASRDLETNLRTLNRLL